MDTGHDKVMPLSEAVGRFVKPGSPSHHRRFHFEPQPHGGRLRNHSPKDHRPAPLRPLQRPGGRRVGRGRLRRADRNRLRRHRTLRPDLHPLQEGGPGRASGRGGLLQLPDDPALFGGCHGGPLSAHPLFFRLRHCRTLGIFRKTSGPPTPAFPTKSWWFSTTPSGAGAMRPGWCWCRPSTRMSPCFTSSRPTARERRASPG